MSWNIIGQKVAGHSQIINGHFTGSMLFVLLNIKSPIRGNMFVGDKTFLTYYCTFTFLVEHSLHRTSKGFSDLNMMLHLNR